MNTFAVILAAGRGSRLAGDTPKQYLSIAGHTVLEHALASFLALPNFKQVIVVVAKEDEKWRNLKVLQHSKVQVIEGGDERLDSSLQALNSLADKAKTDDWICIHDAARPCIGQQDIETLLAKVVDHPVGGLLAYPVVDTLKKVGADRCVIETVDRHDLWHAVTPQLFRYGLLKSALEKSRSQGALVTDSASAMEQQGFQPLIIEGARSNIKLTYEDDLPLIEFYLQSRI